MSLCSHSHAVPTIMLNFLTKLLELSTHLVGTSLADAGHLPPHVVALLFDVVAIVALHFEGDKPLRQFQSLLSRYGARMLLSSARQGWWTVPIHVVGMTPGMVFSLFTDAAAHSQRATLVSDEMPAAVLAAHRLFQSAAFCSSKYMRLMLRRRCTRLAGWRAGSDAPTLPPPSCV